MNATEVTFSDFGEKFLFAPRGVLYLKPPFLIQNSLKLVILSYILQTVHQIFMIFSQMLGIIVLNDFVLFACTKKFSFAPQGGAFVLKKPLFKPK